MLRTEPKNYFFGGKNETPITLEAFTSEARRLLLKSDGATASSVVKEWEDIVEADLNRNTRQVQDTLEPGARS